MWLVLPLLATVASAAPNDAVFRAETAEGILVFTDSPQHNALVEGPEYEVFYPGGPPPKVTTVSASTFPELDTWDSIIVATSRRHGVPAALLKAVALAESGMNPLAESHAGAQGLMQLMPGTAQGLGVVDPFDPVESLDGGARYLQTQLRRFGSTSLALAAYNAGPGNVTRHGGIPPFEETRTYVDRVLDLYAHFRDVAPVRGAP